MIAIIKIVPWNNRPGPSITTDPIAAVVEVKSRMRITWISASTNEPSATLSCAIGRIVLPTNASINTPIRAPAKIISIGASNEYERVGALKIMVIYPQLSVPDR